MPRAATTTDVFNAIAEPRRRELIDFLVDGKPYAVGDMVEVHRRLLDHLKIERLLAVVGGSLGGHQALTWAARFPERVRGVVPLARIAEPEEVAAAVVWLCSSQASYVTGAILAADGGWLAG